MTRDDDQDWLDSLAGRGRPESAASREAGALRAAILRRRAAEESAAVASQDAARETVLIERARRAGLLPGGSHSRGPRFWRPSWTRGALLAAAAALVLVALVPGRWLRPSMDTGVVRSSPDGVVRLQAEDSVALKRQLTEELRAAGVVAAGYELLGRQGIDADLPRPLPDEVRRVLDRHGIPVPADGVLRVEIESKEPR
jgi:hypothetical protein